MKKNINHSPLCLMIPYFGQWPVYFDLFLYTAAKQKDLHVLLFTDISYAHDLPANVEMVHFSLEDFNTLVSERLGFEIAITNPYKLCDLKPAYGYIFEDYIKSYSHWAFGDLDLIYGDVFGLLPKNWRDYDVLSFREEWISGSFAVVRNSTELNRLFQNSKSYKEAFISQDHQAFDECWDLYEVLKGKDMTEILSCDSRESFTWTVKSAEEKGDLLLYCKRLIKESIYQDDYVKYENGKVVQKDGREFIYYHYITEKNTFLFSFPHWKKIPDAFYIDQTGFFTVSEYMGWKRIFIRSGRMLVGSWIFVMSLPRRVYSKILRMMKRKG